MTGLPVSWRPAGDNELLHAWGLQRADLANIGLAEALCRFTAFGYQVGEEQQDGPRCHGCRVVHGLQLAEQQSGDATWRG